MFHHGLESHLYHWVASLLYLHSFYHGLMFKLLSLILQGRYAEAESHYVSAMRILERVLGPEHPHVATVLNDQIVVVEKQVKMRGKLGKIYLALQAAVRVHLRLDLL